MTKKLEFTPSEKTNVLKLINKLGKILSLA